jgi:hypothetical protein
MIQFIQILLTAISISFMCFIIGILVYPDEYETAEEFIKQESVWFIAAFMVISIIGLPFNILFTSLFKDE